MKKIIIIGLLLIISSLYIFTNDNQTQEEPKILSELKDNGNINGKREFIFSLTNVGKENATLQFLSWLEYNVTLDSSDHKELPSGEKIFEHLDLIKDNEEGRLLVLEPNQRIEYRLLVGGIPKGNYEITISSSSGYGTVKKAFFTVQ